MSAWSEEYQRRLRCLLAEAAAMDVPDDVTVEVTAEAWVHHYSTATGDETGVGVEISAPGGPWMRRSFDGLGDLMRALEAVPDVEEEA